jgi:hypothetical protein
VTALAQAACDATTWADVALAASVVGIPAALIVAITWMFRD